MAKQKRMGWFNKISKWILDVFPGQESQQSQELKASVKEKSNKTETTKQATPQHQRSLEAEEPRPTKDRVDQYLPEPARKDVRKLAASVVSTTEPPVKVQSEQATKTILKAWKDFKIAWSNTGLSDHFFLEQDELNKTFSLLDKSFKEELIEWLFQLCTKPEALKDLARIIERNQVKPTDNIDAIRAFEYVNIAVSATPKQPKPDIATSVESDQSQPVEAIKSVLEEPEVDRIQKKADAEDIEWSPTGIDMQPIDTFDQGRETNEQATSSNQPIEDLGLSIRAINCLKRGGIHILLDLAGKSEAELLNLKNFGQKSVKEVREALHKLNLSLPFGREEITRAKQSSAANGKVSEKPNAASRDDLKSLSLTQRTLNCLYRGQIFFVSELIEKTESDLLMLPNIGQTALSEITTCLADLGLSLSNERPRIQNRETAESKEADALGEAWLQLEQEAIQQTGKAVLSFQQLEQLVRQNPGNPASKYLHELLDRLNVSIEFINDTLTHQNHKQAESLRSSIQLLKEAICNQILERSYNDACQWVNRITKSFTSQSERSNWLIYLLRCSGKTLSSIAEDQNPPLSRKRVRQMESRASKIIGIKSVDLAEKLQQVKKAKEQSREELKVKEWLMQLGRLPTRDDPRQEQEDHSSFWDQVCKMNLKERIALLLKYKLEISKVEYDYHYKYIIQQIGGVGTGYWHEFENLKQFILLHAAALEAPDLMPKQTSFPDSIRGVVTRYGGQSKVAKRIGLKYQGQLVGVDGTRTYWTEDRLNQLLIDTNKFHEQNHDLMPNSGQILEFFSATEINEYKDKKPHSAIVALTKGGSLHWSEVAKRFGKRFVRGESQKAVTLSSIKAFVRDLGEHLDSLSPSELFVLFQAQGINRGEKEKFSRTFDALVDNIQSGMINKDELRSWADNNNVKSIDDLLDLGAELKAESSTEEKEQRLLERRSKQITEEFPDQEGTTEISTSDLPTLEPANILKALDKAADLVDNSATDRDKVEFLKAKASAKLWDACFRDEQALIKKLSAFSTETDSYSQEIQQVFLDEYYGAKTLPIPTTYAFRDLKGNPRDPKLMQRLVAYRLERDLRLLNLSGTGTGKTLSAIYAAQICGCKRILISCPNVVIESWRRAFTSAFPSANLVIKPEGWSLEGIDQGVNVVIVNHERFQDSFAQQLRDFCVNYQADMIVIDEIHQSKRRSADKSSQRRKWMNEFIRISSNINTNLRVVGLSATPVINNLYEGRSLIELIFQKSIDDVDENVNLNSCMNLYQHFVVHGIRMNPGELPRTKLIHQEIDATPLLPQIMRATKTGNYHDIEQLLVTPKIASLNNCLVRGEKTVIFITYIKNTLRPITRWLAENNYSFSVYTGDEKEAQDECFNNSLDEFIYGNSEVLVASIKCTGIGIDGLQSVCNRAIFFQLPWTSTEFEQAIGRLDRDGTDFEFITIQIPMTVITLPNGQRWSWCRSKLNRIESKRDITKAAVDGEIPDAARLISPSEASKYWFKWLEKLNQESSQALTNRQ